MERGEYRNELKELAGKESALLAEFKGTSLLVSGAAGLIGSYVVDLLCAANMQSGFGIKICACDRDERLLNERFPDGRLPGLRKVVADVTCDELPDEHFDYMVHAASNTSPADYAVRPVDTIWTNVAGAKRLMDLAVRHRTRRFLFCSSVEAYGKNMGDVDAFSEDYSGYVDSNTLRAGYPSAKRCVEALCNAYAAEHADFDFVVARIGRIFGPNVRPGDAKAPSQFLQDGRERHDVVMKSAGTQVYSWGYVSDCATAMLTILAKGVRGEAYNVAHPEPMRLCDFARTVAECAGVGSVKKEQTDAEKSAYSKIDKATLDVGKLLALGWRPSVSIAEGIRRTLGALRG